MNPLLRILAAPRPGRRARPPIPSVALLSALVLVLGACSPAAAPTLPPDATGSLAPPATGLPSAVPGGSSVGSPAQSTPAPSVSYPLVLRDDEGTGVTIPARPGRIVSLTPAVTETLFAIGAGDRVVGKVEDVTPYPPAADAVPVVAKFGSVDVEKIVSLRADLVVAGGNGFNPPESVARLRSLGIPVVVVYAPDVATVFRDVELVGQAAGEPSAAADLAASMRAGFDEVAAATRSLPHPRTFYELDATKEIYGPAKDSFLAAMIGIAGGDPITTGSPTAYNVPLEALVSADPEVILLGDGAYGTTAADVAKRPGWGGLTAVRTGAIRPVDDVLVSRPGPRLVQGLQALARAIHPELPPFPEQSVPPSAAASSTAAASAAPSPAPSAAGTP